MTSLSWGCSSGVCRARWVALAGIVEVWRKRLARRPGVLRAASINAEIFPPELAAWKAPTRPLDMC